MSHDPTILADRIEGKSHPDARGCLIWTGALNSRGYGCIGVGGKSQLTHRVAYELYYGPIPEGLTIDHGCYEPRCVNPLHLEAVTGAENTRRAIPRKLGQARVSGVGRLCAEGHLVAGDNLAINRGREICVICHRRDTRMSQRRVRAEGPRYVEQGAELLAIRNALGWRQQDMADVLGIISSGQAIYSEWERGRTRISDEHLTVLRGLIERAA